MKPVLLSTAYLPSLTYFYYLLNSEKVFMEKQEHFQKQSFRNRCRIYSANGKLDLVIPLQKNGDKELISAKKISYAENWQAKHWTAITSAYKNAPYFEYFEEEFRFFYEKQFDLLFEYNLELIELVLKILRINKTIDATQQYEKEFAGIDLRDSIHPKKQIERIAPLELSYYQVFAGKHGFIKDLSIIDLLFNKGLETKEYLAV